MAENKQAYSFKQWVADAGSENAIQIGAAAALTLYILYRKKQRSQVRDIMKRTLDRVDVETPKIAKLKKYIEKGGKVLKWMGVASIAIDVLDTLTDMKHLLVPSSSRIADSELRAVQAALVKPYEPTVQVTCSIDALAHVHALAVAKDMTPLASALEQLLANLQSDAYHIDVRVPEVYAELFSNVISSAIDDIQDNNDANVGAIVGYVVTSHAYKLIPFSKYFACLKWFFVNFFGTIGD